jgi:hypothetical protein
MINPSWGSSWLSVCVYFMAAIVATIEVAEDGRVTFIQAYPRCGGHSEVTLTDLRSQAAVVLLKQVQFTTQHNQTCLACEQAAKENQRPSRPDTPNRQVHISL